jgi:hypothetical protein
MTVEIPGQAGLAYEPSQAEMDEWNANVSDAIEVEGYSLYGGKENDHTLDSLVGVPFVIKHVTFRHGDIIPDGMKTPRDYVSVEALIHPKFVHAFPRRYVVFNDGSTGIYRQIVAALVATGQATVPDDMPEEGGSNATRYDVSYSRPIQNADESITWSAPEFKIHILCPEGLRRSDYTAPNGVDAVTWYLA